MWARRYHAIVVSDEEEAQVGRLAYLLAHGVKEGLVARPQDWPGVHCVAALLGGGTLAGTWFDRTALYAAAKRGEEKTAFDFAEPEVVAFAPLPCWAQLSPEAVRTRVAELVETLVEDARRSRGSRPPMGRQAIVKQHPHERPMRSNRSPAPAVHAASKAIRLMLRTAYWEFVASFRAAAERLRRGDRLVDFPRGAFPPPLPCTAPT